MSEGTSTDRDTFPGPQHLDRMVRVSPLTISAVYKKRDKAGQGYVLNLSRGGIFFTANDSFELGETVRVQFFLPFQLGQIDAHMIVRWRTQDVDTAPPELRAGFGLEFLDAPVETRDKISRFIERFIELAEQLED